MRLVPAHLGEYHRNEDELRGAGQRDERGIFSAQDCAADFGFAASGRYSGKNGIESGSGCGHWRVPSAGYDDGALRAGGFYLAAEFAGDSDRELFRVPGAACADHSLLSRGRDLIWRAALATLGVAGCGHGTGEFLGSNSSFVDDDLARHDCVVLGGAGVCGNGLCAARADLAASDATGGKGKSDRLKSVPPQRALENVEDFFVALEGRN